MLLDLREIINVPGGLVSFNCEVELGDSLVGSAREVLGPARVTGFVKNTAGVLDFHADLAATLLCVCARCLKEFHYPVDSGIDATIIESDVESEEEDFFNLVGDSVDVDEIVITSFVLGMEQRQFCSDDCKGLCEKCGADLNEGPCTCTADIDPRLAVLGQLLEND